MNLFDKKNKITDTVYKVENFINVDFYDEYIEILKKINNLNFGAGWILNNCSLDELQDKIDTSKFKISILIPSSLKASITFNCELCFFFNRY